MKAMLQDPIRPSSYRFTALSSDKGSTVNSVAPNGLATPWTAVSRGDHVASTITEASLEGLR